VDVELVAVTVDRKPVLANLLQLYLHDFCEFRPAELSAQGTFDYLWLSSYFNAPEREAYLITSGDRLAGFAMIRCDVEGDEGAWNVSEFFVVRGHRRSGVAREAAGQLFRRHPGVWTLSYLHHNVPAARMWPAVADSVADGPVVRADRCPPAVPAGGARRNGPPALPCSGKDRRARRGLSAMTGGFMDDTCHRPRTRLPEVAVLSPRSGGASSRRCRRPGRGGAGRLPRQPRRGAAPARARHGRGEPRDQATTGRRSGDRREGPGGRARRP
jgi:predicted acetyltransferase